MSTISIKKLIVLVVGLLLLFVSYRPVLANECPGNLVNNADVINNPPGNDYDVYYRDDTTSVDHCPPARAWWVSNALLNSHNVFVDNTHNFLNPYFSVVPNDTCIYNLGAPGLLGSANRSVIKIDSGMVNNSTEPFVRNTVSHELFHHVQYHYHINPDQWPSWGSWTIEGTAAAMEDKTFLDIDTDWSSLYIGRVWDLLTNRWACSCFALLTFQQIIEAYEHE